MPPRATDVFPPSRRWKSNKFWRFQTCAKGDKSGQFRFTKPIRRSKGTAFPAPDPCVIYVGSLVPSTTRADMKALFEPFSPLRDVRLDIVAGKTCRRSVYVFILWISLMTKIEIERKCCHGHSNHELNVNAVIVIQIIRHIDALFLRDIQNMNKRTVSMFFLSLELESGSQFCRQRRGTLRRGKRVLHCTAA
jgi:hypothetical protein